MHSPRHAKDAAGSVALPADAAVVVNVHPPLIQHAATRGNAHRHRRFASAPVVLPTAANTPSSTPAAYQPCNTGALAASRDELKPEFESIPIADQDASIETGAAFQPAAALAACVGNSERGGDCTDDDSMTVAVRVADDAMQSSSPKCQVLRVTDGGSGKSKCDTSDCIQRPSNPRGHSECHKSDEPNGNLSLRQLLPTATATATATATPNSTATATSTPTSTPFALRPLQPAFVISQKPHVRLFSIDALLSSNNRHSSNSSSNNSGNSGNNKTTPAAAKTKGAHHRRSHSTAAALAFMPNTLSPPSTETRRAPQQQQQQSPQQPQPQPQRLDPQGHEPRSRLQENSDLKQQQPLPRCSDGDIGRNFGANLRTEKSSTSTTSAASAATAVTTTPATAAATNELQYVAAPAIVKEQLHGSTDSSWQLGHHGHDSNAATTSASSASSMALAASAVSTTTETTSERDSPVPLAASGASAVTTFALHHRDMPLRHPLTDFDSRIGSRQDSPSIMEPAVIHSDFNTHVHEVHSHSQPLALDSSTASPATAMCTPISVFDQVLFDTAGSHSHSHSHSIQQQQQQQQQQSQHEAPGPYHKLPRMQELIADCHLKVASAAATSSATFGTPVDSLHPNGNGSGGGEGSHYFSMPFGQGTGSNGAADIHIIEPNSTSVSPGDSSPATNSVSWIKRLVAHGRYLKPDDAQFELRPLKRVLGRFNGAAYSLERTDTADSSTATDHDESRHQAGGGDSYVPLASTTASSAFTSPKMSPSHSRRPSKSLLGVALSSATTMLGSNGEHSYHGQSLNTPSVTLQPELVGHMGTAAGLLPGHHVGYGYGFGSTKPVGLGSTLPTSLDSQSKLMRNPVYLNAPGDGQYRNINQHQLYADDDRIDPAYGLSDEDDDEGHEELYYDTENFDDDRDSSSPTATTDHKTVSASSTAASTLSRSRSLGRSRSRSGQFVDGDPGIRDRVGLRRRRKLAKTRSFITRITTDNVVANTGSTARDHLSNERSYMSWLKIVVVLGCLGVKMIGDAMKALKSTPPATVAAAAAAAAAASEDTAGGSKKAGLMGLNWHAASIVGIVWYAISLTILAVATLNYVYVYRKYTRERQPLKINRFVWSLLFLIGTASLVYLISILAISANS